jgi:hypothetical protein
VNNPLPSYGYTACSFQIGLWVSVFTLHPGFIMGNENRISLIRVNTSSRETLLSKIGLKRYGDFFYFKTIERCKETKTHQYS